MKEVEIKAHLKDANAVIAKLAALGAQFSDPVSQTDTVYTKLPADTVAGYLANDHFVRVREKGDGKTILTAKRPLSAAVLTKLEHETEVADARATEAMLRLMGYQPANVVRKHRRTATHGAIEICIDEVDGLGTFIEVEMLAEGETDQVRADLETFLASLGVPAADEIRKGYDIMAIESRI